MKEPWLSSFAHHQFYEDLRVRNDPRLQRLAHGHARVFLAVRDREGHCGLRGVVQRRDALEKRADFRERLVAVPPASAGRDSGQRKTERTGRMPSHLHSYDET